MPDGIQLSATRLKEEEHMSTARSYRRLRTPAMFCLAACITLLSIPGRAAENQATKPTSNSNYR